MSDEKRLCPETGKVCYSQKEANTVKNRFKRHVYKGNHRSYRMNTGANGKIPVRSYRCEFCGSWHLTSQKY